MKGTVMERRDIIEMKDGQLGDELRKAYVAIGKQGASTTNVFIAQELMAEAAKRLDTYATRLGFKIEEVSNLLPED
jgi:hypothetical protein